MADSAALHVGALAVHDLVPVSGGDICVSARGRTGDGRPVFVKTRTGAPAGFFAVEARNLDRLRSTDGPPVPAVVAVGGDALVLEWVPPGRADERAAADLGAALARLHAAADPATGFGWSEPGFIGPLPLDNTPSLEWPTFYAERRLRPHLDALAPAERRPVEQVIDHLGDLAGPVVAPALLHGDLWAGNILWAADGRCRLVDAAAVHQGHPETDLAMLALFGAPHLDVILDGYRQVTDLPDGWRTRVPLHQLHPLLVHARLFGGGYGARAAAAARTLLTG